jgi:hypothetical protein
MDYLRKVYQLNISLLGVIPEVWRQLRVADSDTLADLHDTLQIAMGWTDIHMHMFIREGEKYGIPDEQFPDDTRNEQQTRLRQLLKKPGDGLLYIYDFGDAWEHRPICCYGERACPPEDVGGPPGYDEFLEATADPSHPEHDYMTRWIGGEFSPERFDLDLTNDLLRDKHLRLG